MIKTIKLIFILAIPLFLLIGPIRFIASDSYLKFEYGKSDFPPDPFGFTISQRMKIASENLRFVRDNLPLDALSSQVFEGDPVYNSRELGHMLDVQKVYQSVWSGWQLIVLFIILTGSLLWRLKGRLSLLSAIQAGGLLTSGLIFALGLFAIVAWQVWFTAFHQIFFQPGSWTFEYSDTLIRLFPEKFWFDSALSLLSFGFIEGLLVALLGSHWKLILQKKIKKDRNRLSV